MNKRMGGFGYGVNLDLEEESVKSRDWLNDREWDDDKPSPWGNPKSPRSINGNEED